MAAVLPKSVAPLEINSASLPTIGSPEPGPSTPTPAPNPPPLCGLCKTKDAIYTCPRCAAKTCSAACSKGHKQSTGCSGERNKAAYVPMSQYGWGTMMDDYVFLEDLGRKVADVGSEIVRGGYGHGTGSNTRGAGYNGRGARGHGRGRGRGRGRGGGGGGIGRTKRDIFKLQMEVRDIDVDFLPLGMMRRKVNQSSWDFKNKTALLTIEFKFHRPRDPLAPSSRPDDPPLMLLTHRNRMDKPLLSILQSIVKEHTTSASSKKANNADLEWLKTLVLPSPDDPEGFNPPHCVMAAPVDPLSIKASRTQKPHYRLDVHQPLASALKNIQIVEFPTIEVWEEFRGTIVDPQGVVTQRVERVVKRRKVDKKVGRETIKGLLGSYGSEDEDEEEQDKENVMSMLGDYVASDDDEEREHSSAVLDQELPAGADLEASMSDDEDVAEELDPAALLELVRQVKGEQWTEEAGDEDILDWEPSDGEDGEEERALQD